MFLDLSLGGSWHKAAREQTAVAAGFPSTAEIMEDVNRWCRIFLFIKSGDFCGFKSLLLRCCRGLKNSRAEPLSLRKNDSVQEPGYSIERFVSPHVSVSEP